jgi:hypothetical protein
VSGLCADPGLGASARIYRAAAEQHHLQQQIQHRCGQPDHQCGEHHHSERPDSNHRTARCARAGCDTRRARAGSGRACTSAGRGRRRGCCRTYLGAAAGVPRQQSGGHPQSAAATIQTFGSGAGRAGSSTLRAIDRTGSAGYAGNNSRCNTSTWRNATGRGAISGPAGFDDAFDRRAITDIFACGCQRQVRPKLARSERAAAATCYADSTASPNRRHKTFEAPWTIVGTRSAADSELGCKAGRAAVTCGCAATAARGCSPCAAATDCSPGSASATSCAPSPAANRAPGASIAAACCAPGSAATGCAPGAAARCASGSASPAASGATASSAPGAAASGRGASGTAGRQTVHAFEWPALSTVPVNGMIINFLNYLGHFDVLRAVAHLAQSGGTE